MAALINSVAGRLMLIALLIHAVLLPLLLNAVLYVVRQSNEEVFVNHARIYARSIADMIASSGAIDDDARLVDLLDSAMLSSDGVYAEVRDGQRTVQSALAAREDAAAFREDFAFGEHGDSVYYLSIPLQVPGHTAVLRLGLDEQATTEAIGAARQTLLWILAVYLVVALALLLLLSVYLTRPLRTLRRASQKIASGHYTEQLRVDSHMLEISQLATDLELMRSALVGVNRQLANEIQERLAAEEQREVLQGQLLHAQKLETVGTLAGGIAHEFNNILVPITLYAEAVLDELGRESSTGQHVARVLKAANRAKALVQQILAFSRQGGPEQRRIVRVGPVVEEAVKLLRAVIPASVDIQTDIDPKAGPVLADSAQIHQLVMNLCNNAYQALHAHGGRLRITARNQQVNAALARKHPDLEEGPYVVVSVIDDGHGIDPLTLERIFEPFFTTRAVGEGTGLGLAVAHGITKAHEGTILVDSVLGRGSQFDVYLPVRRNAAHSPASPQERIIYMSRDAASLGAHVQALQAMGYEISTPGNTLELLEALEDEHASTTGALVMDRRALLEVVDRLPPMAHRPPMILLCAFGDIITPAEQARLGVSACLVEPVEAPALASEIRQILQRESAHA